MAASSSCICCICAWSCCACFIMPIKSFMVSSPMPHGVSLPCAAAQGALSRGAIVVEGAAQGPNLLDLRLGESLEQGLYRRMRLEFGDRRRLALAAEFSQ